jgi:hypothetical protein
MRHARDGYMPLNQPKERRDWFLYVAGFFGFAMLAGILVVAFFGR